MSAPRRSPSSRIGPRAAVLAAAVVAAIAGACSRPAGPDVVVIVMDTARPDYLSVYGHPRPTSPFLEHFASAGTRYDRAYSTSCWTLPAHASLFSGTGVEHHQTDQESPHVPDDVPLLAERLAAAGYQTVAFSANPWVAPETGLARGFETFVPTVTWPADGYPVAQHALAPGVARWLQEERDPDRPLFLFVNFVEPHLPYLPDWGDARPFFDSPEACQAAKERLFPDPWQTLMSRNYGLGEPLSESEWAQLRALYEGELRRADSIVWRLVSAVDAATDPAKTLVFVLSDHGENLGDHGHVSHNFNLYDSNLRIALLARGPGFVPGAADDRLAEITDLYPTILHAAGLEAGPELSGRALRGPRDDGRILHAAIARPVITMQALPKPLVESGVLARFDQALEAVVGGCFKRIVGPPGVRQDFDLCRDPGETTPLRPEDLPAPSGGDLDAALARAHEIDRVRAPEAGPGGIPSGLERAVLHHLGYAGDDEER